ncbi:flavin reductase [Aeromicrobium sp. UC242_57]|uniref:flavin reductase n=1 Tax=Aeromicrobium sp. UC242_57 TaxID=3374624 RepID=UPI00378F2B53
MRGPCETRCSSFATGVAVVTASGLDGEPVGLTVNSFNSVSLEPPLVLWSLALTSRRLPAFRQAKYWGVHILAADQEQVSNRFASSSKNRFDDLAYHLSAEGVPLIEGCAARFVCRTTFEYEGGDHAIFVGEVLDLESAVSPPLIFHGGQYRRVLSVPPREVPARLDNDGEFGRYFIGHTLGRVYSDAFRELRQECSVRGLSGRDYTVLVSLGLGDGCDIESLQRRAARGGARLSVDAVDDMARRGIVDIDAGLVRLTTQGNRLLSEIIAVSQASHFRLQDKLAPEEFSTLEHLLDKLAPDA